MFVRLKFEFCPTFSTSSDWILCKPAYIVNVTGLPFAEEATKFVILLFADKQKICSLFLPGILLFVWSLTLIFVRSCQKSKWFSEQSLFAADTVQQVSQCVCQLPRFSNCHSVSASCHGSAAATVRLPAVTVSAAATVCLPAVTVQQLSRWLCQLSQYQQLPQCVCQLSQYSSCHGDSASCHSLSSCHSVSAAVTVSAAWMSPFWKTSPPVKGKTNPYFRTKWKYIFLLFTATLRKT